MKFYVGVIGGSDCSEKESILAYNTGKLIAQNHAVLVCGGLGGVMYWAAKGAKDAGGLTVGIIPGMVRSEANEYIDIVIPTGIGYLRNFMVVRASDVLIAIGGSTGTLSEIAMALNDRKTVISLKSWDLDISKVKNGKYLIASTPEDALKLAIEEANKNSKTIFTSKPFQ